MASLVERLRALYVWPQSVADHYADTLTPRQIKQLYEVGFAADEAADRITALEAMCETLAGFAEHDSDCVLGIPKAIRSRSSIQEECTCGLSEALTEYRAMKEKNDG